MSRRTLLRHMITPRYLPEAVRKLWQRPKYSKADAAEATAWAAGRSVALDDWASTQDPAVWAQAQAFASAAAEAGEKVLRSLKMRGVELGGGGATELLYFLARKLRPEFILETGVAAGWSSYAFLQAIADNHCGTLLSSDFPYLRLDHPEQYVGVIVPDHLRRDWRPLLKGDRKNLEELLPPGRLVELFHYDSDKSRDGRTFFIERTREHVAAGAVIVMDDIGDDLFFRDFAAGRTDVLVFQYGGKHLGMLGWSNAT